MNGIAGISTTHQPISNRAINSKRRTANRTLKELEQKQRKKKSKDRSLRTNKQNSSVQKPDSDVAIDSVIDSVLQVNQPQRIKAPQHLNAPERLQGTTIDQELLMKSFSPAAHREIYHTPDTDLPKQKSTVTTTSDKFAFDTLIADVRMMATACRRSGLKDGEGIAQYKLGVLLDNTSKHEEAIKAYAKYLRLCEELGDTRGVALAVNCMGVDFQIMAKQVRLIDAAQHFKLLNRALDNHKRHVTVTDLTGKFVALSNCGLVLTAMEDYEPAIQYHQKALTVSLQLKNKLMQSVAMGNIGYVGQLDGDYESAKEAIAQHVDLAKSLGDHAAQSKGYQVLGCFASVQQDYELAIDCFEVSHQLAKDHGCPGLVKVAKCHIGAARGNDRFEAEMEKLATRLRGEL